MENVNEAAAVIPPGRITADDVVYISGPMTGFEDYNRKAFNAVDTWLRNNIGCTVLNPARHPDGLRYGEYMRRAYRDLTMASAVVLLPGWESSRGAMAEVHAAGITGLAVATIESVVGSATDKAVEKIDDWGSAVLHGQ